MTSVFETEVLYLKRLEEYRTTKPYEVMFKLDAFDKGAQQANCVLEPTPVTFTNARLAPPLPTLKKNGFQLVSSPCVLQAAYFEDEGHVSNIYLPLAKECVAKALGEQQPAEMHSCQLTDPPIRKRNSDFPAVAMERTGFLQPILSAHCDFSPNGARPALDEMIARNPHLENWPFQIIKRVDVPPSHLVWRMINGPTSDWPLAVCGYQSLDLDKDIEECDRVASDRTTESILLYHNPAHRWYFFEGLAKHEVAVFRNCDSRGYHVPFGIHISFDFKTDSLPKLPRESVEIRVVCFF
ncbi:hypothetical protein B0H67DRAFT_499877 [Lasiosphaeris hirsuta]|uniref:Methyltransferase n=1 Tax=Lasiosphaeris hirsuta TaxID=260670 RepID=A0AA40DGM3_9PEZI|nr:hypothetical protein B0H67DRAFT_499877 [Lasiosphaeris hirsuta]